MCRTTVSRNADNSENSIICNNCKKIHHIKCANIKPEELNAVKNQWKCPNCNKGRSEVNLSEIISKFNKMKDDLQVVKSTVTKIEGKLNDVVELGNAIMSNKDEIDHLKAENTSLKKSVNHLEALSRQNNVVITGITETPNENLIDILKIVCNKLEIDFREDSVVKVCRFKSTSSDKKPILVVLNSSIIKLRMIQSFKEKYKKSNMTVNTDEFIFIGEHLGPALQHLLRLVKSKLIKSNLYKHAWIQNGNVLIRKSSTSKILRVKCEEDVSKFSTMDA